LETHLFAKCMILGMIKALLKYECTYISSVGISLIACPNNALSFEMSTNLIFVFQYVLSVLKFTYPTLFQG
jgi:hypothetical protein